LHLLPEWRLRGAKLGDVPITEQVWFEQLVNLPINPQLGPEDMHYMAEAVRWAMAELGGSSFTEKCA
jgi:dTDP-4-amino-4,6-dideoxygalactose transaminase